MCLGDKSRVRVSLTRVWVGFGCQMSGFVRVRVIFVGFSGFSGVVKFLKFWLFLMHFYARTFFKLQKIYNLKKKFEKKNFIWWKPSSFLEKNFNWEILRFFRQKWPLFWSKFLYFGYPENILGFECQVLGRDRYRPLGFGSGLGGIKCRVFVFSGPLTHH